MPINQVYRYKAQILKALAHPVRLLIVEKLLEKEQCVNDIRELVNVSQPNISQHLNTLRFSGIVDFRQQGNLRCYFLRNPQNIKKVLKALE
jgi:ArsR family transcriptional regulator